MIGRDGGVGEEMHHLAIRTCKTEGLKAPSDKTTNKNQQTTINNRAMNYGNTAKHNNERTSLIFALAQLDGQQIGGRAREAQATIEQHLAACTNNRTKRGERTTEQQSAKHVQPKWPERNDR